MWEPIRTIVVGVASPEASDPALLQALGLARTLGASLHVVHAIGSRGAGHPEAAAAELERTLRDAVHAAAAGTRVACHVAEGVPAERLCEVARAVSAELLVLGASRRRRVWRQFLGSTVEAAVRCAPVPVLVVRQSLPPEPRRVLLATDLSPAGEEAHEHALDVVKTLFRGSEPELRALLAVQDTAIPPAITRPALERIAQREIDRFLRERRPRGRAVQGRVRLGDPAEEILSEAGEWQADLVVLGVRGRAGADVPPLGRVTGAVLRRVGASVLTIPGVCAATEGGEPLPVVAVPAAPAPSITAPAVP